MIDFLRTTLPSFINNYQAVMWRLRESSLNDEQLGLAVGLSGNAVRNRRTKPDLWKLSDVEQLAAHFGLPTTASKHLSQLLVELPAYMKGLSASERRRTERLLVMKMTQFESFNKSDWPVRHLLRIHHALMESN